MKLGWLRFIRVADIHRMHAVWLLVGAVCLGALGLRAAGYARAQGGAVPAPVISTASASTAQLTDGSKVYARWCVECHNARGFATVKLRERYQDSEPAILTERKDLNADLVKYVVRNGISFMPSFRKTEITDRELAALSNYLATDPAKRPKAK